MTKARLAIIAGSRGLTDYEKIEPLIDSYFNKEKPFVVICGCAKGIDSIGRQWADKHGIAVEEYPANWNKYGKSAGYIRNKQMGKVATEALIIWDGKSEGSFNMYEIMKDLDKRVCLVKVDDETC